MMLDYSDYDLEELYEMEKEIKNEIQEREGKIRDYAFEQENMQLEESLENWRES